MDTVALKAPAKINLVLNVVNRRPDGYHEVRMVMQSIGLYDEITVSKSGDDRIVIESDAKGIPLNEDNLIYRAAALIRETCGIKDGVKITLKKNIPVAAGLAGGSTDAAATLKGMNELFDLGLSEDKLCKAGVKIGADVPYCIMGRTALSEGIGEVLTPLKGIPECGILIAKPGIDVSTGYVYKAFDSLKEKDHPDVDAMLKAVDEGDLFAIADNLGNSLEGVTEAEYPVIGKIKETMIGAGALGSLMSGSGPTVFGLFKDRDAACRAADIVKETGMAKDIAVAGPV
ncbi:MAG: 4-(cytidine 5'-diphospho)-2-C-methyl-D-erythritol kinase [Lachnospiraceae bacterium]|nr:4-(cytidine 5'-diphospho)-2-C-methyl-D-erythritol kinase [Lachnospiraceae bacterium]